MVKKTCSVSLLYRKILVAVKGKQEQRLKLHKKLHNKINLGLMANWWTE